MNKRKLLTLAMTLCMVAILAIGGTLAYFTDDEQVTNVMTMGDVEINIEERTYDHENEEWVEFKDENLILYPVDHADNDAKKASGQLWNKVVRTFNTSDNKEDAYIRTIIAVESIPYAGEWETAVAAFFNTDVDYNVWPQIILLDENGVEKEYDVYVCTAANKLPIEYGKYLPSLTSVCLYADVTSEEAAAANGELDIKVLSQAIQAAGFKTENNTDTDAHDAAIAELGEVNQTNLQAWFYGEDAAAEGIKKDLNSFSDNSAN